MHRVGTFEGMFGFPSSELRACVCRRRDTDGWTAPDRTVGLRLRSDPVEQHGRVWQRVVDLNPRLPTLTDVLVNCYDFLVDDDCGREVGWSDGVGREGYLALLVERAALLDLTSLSTLASSSSRQEKPVIFRPATR
jgi:hypothetical protein